MAKSVVIKRQFTDTTALYRKLSKAKLLNNGVLAHNTYKSFISDLGLSLPEGLSPLDYRETSGGVILLYGVELKKSSYILYFNKWGYLYLKAPDTNTWFSYDNRVILLDNAIGKPRRTIYLKINPRTLEIKR